MSTVVKSLHLSFIFQIAALLLLGGYGGSIAFAQTEWARVERCLGLPTAPPDGPFPGMLVLLADDAVRAYRDGVPTTYVLSFAGGNFIRGASISPDGQHIAVPNGVITAVTDSDVRFTVQEIRIVTTGTVPRIVVRVPWRASFPVGSSFTSSGDIPSVRWIDGVQIAYIQGSLTEEQTLVMVDPFTSGATPEPARLQDALSLSPDGSHAVVYRNGVPSLIAIEEAERVVALPSGSDVRRAVWAPDGSKLVVPVRTGRQVALALIDAPTGRRTDIVALGPFQSARSIRWSPDGKRLAYALFDPQNNQNRLHIAEIDTQTVVDLCVELEIAGREPQTAAVAWSPDSSSLAMITAQAAPNAVVSIAELQAGRRWTLLPASGELLGWYD